MYKSIGNVEDSVWNPTLSWTDIYTTWTHSLKLPPTFQHLNQGHPASQKLEAIHHTNHARANHEPLSHALRGYPCHCTRCPQLPPTAAPCTKAGTPRPPALLHTPVNFRTRFQLPVPHCPAPGVGARNRSWRRERGALEPPAAVIGRVVGGVQLSRSPGTAIQRHMDCMPMSCQL